MTEGTAASARLTLRGHDPTPAVLRVVYRPPRTRGTSALLSLLGFWVLAPIVFFIPPHIPWALLAFAAGIYFAYRQWNGEYVVEEFAGSCPRCGAALSVAPGSRIRLPHKLVCFQCHHEPALEPRPV